MRCIERLVTGAFFAATVVLGQPAAPAGDWLGVLDAGVKLRLALHIGKAADGSWQLTWDSPDQGARGLAGKLTIEGETIRLDLRVATYEGTLDKGGAEISGTFTQGGRTLPLVFKKVDKIPEANRPQHPRRPFPYREEEVTVESAGVKLAGTLTLPRGEGRFPSLLLLTGSGPQDRDETLFEHKPFLVLADHFTRRGFAVLRVDDRGVGKSGGSLATVTMEDLAADAVAGVEFLRSRAEVDPAKIGLAGHSEGGVVAPLAAARKPEVAFLVLLAPSGVTGEELLYAQSAEILKAAGVAEAAIERQRQFQGLMFQAVKEETDSAAVAKRIRAGIETLKSELSPAEQAALGDLDKGLDAEVRRLNSPWMRHFLTYDPAPVLRNVRRPVLVLIGELDRQVPPKQNLPAITSALAAGGNADFTVACLPKLNHLFQTARTGSPGEYGQIEETFAPAALEVIAAWLERRK